MPNTLVIDSPKYAIYIRVLKNEGDGPLVTIDSQGHIQVNGADPGPLRHDVQAAAMQIQSAVDAFHAALVNQQVSA